MVRHLIMQAADDIISANEAISAPVMTAPTTLVATNSIASSKTDVSVVPSIPTNSAVTFEQAQRRVMAAHEFVVKKVITKKPIAIPKTTHKNAGVAVISPIIRKIAAVIPSIRLPKTAKNVQSNLYTQLVVFAIFSTSDTVYEKPSFKVKTLLFGRRGDKI